MDKEIKARWLAALRSGEYEQGTGSLRDSEDRFCCLGVLCDVAGLPWKSQGYDYTVDGVGTVGYLPERLADEISVEEQRALVDRNDFKKAPFNEIADYIEENL